MSARPGRVALLGALGRMGAAVREALAEEPGLSLAAALEAPGHAEQGHALEEGLRVGSDVAGALAASDLLIAFATPESTVAAVEACAAAGLPAVVGTTGFGEAERGALAIAAKRIPLVLAANFSASVNVLFHLAREAGRWLGPEFDAEIVELHHGAKVDAPSGTALRLAEAVAEGRGEELPAVTLRSRDGQTGPRPPGAIGIQALRGGDNPGEHVLLLLGRGERLEIAHRSSSRQHFARGAVRAAVWVRERPPGLYDMEQVLGLRS